MNSTIRVAMVAIFTTLGTSYFLAGGVFQLVQMARTPRPSRPWLLMLSPPFLPRLACLLHWKLV